MIKPFLSTSLLIQYEEVKREWDSEILEYIKANALQQDLFKKSDNPFEVVKKKYYDDFAKTKDLYFFLGTTRQFHNVAPNPFIIIGTFHPRHIEQQLLNF